MFGRATREQETTIARLVAHVEAQERQIADLRAERDYWRTRAERLIDAGLARRGEIHEPVMQAAAPKPASGLAGLFAGLGVDEINRSTPGQVASTGA
jgi:hypothetical protein